ncbi:MAG: HigA family addiction module antidote protein [Boseongicola sp. SB0670_bin_30]|nr:HigA family addiction module antidote protein [Boseongicola sp. SB0670_bin_30]
MSITSTLPDIPHPGEFVAEELEARGGLQRDLAYILGVSEQTVNTIISGKRGISPDMANALGDAFNVSPEFFAGLQKAYEMSKACQPDPAVAKRAWFQSHYPIREMIKRRWLVDTDVSMLEAQLTRLFQTDDIKSILHPAYAAKKTTYDEAVSSTQLAWFFRVHQIASEMVVRRYSQKSLEQAVAEMQSHLLDPEDVRHVPRMLADCGVRFVIVETLPGAKIDGVCFWINDDPVIGMTMRFDRIDNFWFVLRHEIEHVLNGDGRQEPTIDVDLAGEAEDANDRLSEEERRANAAAADFCVPSAEMNSFYARKAPYISERDAVGFARRVQRHPGIVVGQLQHRLQRHDYLTRLKVKVRRFVAPSAVVDGWGEPAPVSL